MEELVMKISPRTFNRKAEFKARTKAKKVEHFVTVQPENRYFFYKEHAFYDWLWCRMGNKKRTSKREALETRKYRNFLYNCSVSKRERRFFDHRFRDEMRERELMRYMDEIINFDVDDEPINTSNTGVSIEEVHFKRLPDGTCVYEPSTKDVLKAFDIAADRLLYMHDELHNEDFLFELEMLRARIETQSVTYDNLLNNPTDIALMAGGTVHKKLFIKLLSIMLCNLS